MKKIMFLVLLILLSVNEMNAQEIINYFYVADNIAKPVKLNTSVGQLTIWGGERKDGNISIYSAYDANGNQIVNTTPYKTDIGTNKPTVRYYRFQTLYNSTSNNKTQPSSSNRSKGSDFADKLGDYAVRAAAIPQEGFPNLQVRVGASFFMAEYASLKAELGGVGGFVICGGLGKSLFDKAVEGKSWYAGLGYYGGDEDFSFSLNFLYLDSHRILSRILAFELEFSYFFEGGRFGVFADGQMGICFDANTDAGLLKFNIGAGIAWKLFSE